MSIEYVNYTNGAQIRIYDGNRARIILKKFIVVDDNAPASADRLKGALTAEQDARLIDLICEVGGRNNGDAAHLPIEAKDAVLAFAASIWGQPVGEAADDKPTATPAENDIEESKHPSQTETGPFPWQTGEKHNWYYADGKGGGWVRRTTDAHEVGRLLLRKHGPGNVLIYDDQNGALLATIDSAAPVCRRQRDIEQAVEEARRAKFAHDTAMRRLRDRIEVAHGEYDPETKHRHSANQLAAMAHGLASRPTVLKWLSVDADEADD